MSVVRTPSATATMMTFRINTPLFRACLAHIGSETQLTPAQRTSLEGIAKSLQDFMQTPFYYYEIAPPRWRVVVWRCTTQRRP